MNGMCTYDVFGKGSVDSETTIFHVDTIWKLQRRLVSLKEERMRVSYLALSPCGTAEGGCLIRGQKHSAHRGGNAQIHIEDRSRQAI